MILWPEVLPQRISGYNGDPGDGLIRTPMEVGPAKVRRRITAVPKPVSGYIIITPEQFAFFEYWYEYVLLGGALRFGWTAPFSTKELTNLLTNGGFGSGTTGWTPNDATLASIADGIFGNCLEITSTGGAQQDAYQSVTLSAAHIYSLASYVKSGSAGDDAFYLIAYDGVNEISEYIQSITSDAWVHHQLNFTAVGTSFGIYCRKYTTHAESPGTMLFDQVFLVDITSGVVDMRFVERYHSSGHGARIRIDMKLEILP